MCKRFFLLSFIIVIATINLSRAQNLPLIPMPAHLVRGTGTFDISPQTTIIIPHGYFSGEADQLNQILIKGLGRRLKVINSRASHSIQLVNDASMTAPEAYGLEITPSKVTISAGSPAGIFHAIETIRQLLPAEIESGKTYKHLSIPALKINDAPAYAWRGMHLDVSRHFFGISYLKKLIDVMALYKMNKLHLHLTDDQGWRIEIKKYPKLTGEGAWRSFDINDSVCMKREKDNPDFKIDGSHIIHRDGKILYGGFYTQQQMKALVAYAASRHIDIIPEIDMPGHMMAAINAYPFLTCNEVNKKNDFSEPICPCNEKTFEFAENIFTEIMAIFPSEYIHIGGDEVERSQWAKSPACKALMEREGIKDLPALQSYFINRMEKFFNSKGRKLIGWDEIIEGGISPTAKIMYWRTWVPDAPVKAVKNGNQVIMAPGEPLYFDNQPDQYSVYKVYHFNPVPKGLTATEAGLIIGGQACTWSETIPSEKRADYMIMPRMTALAENLWTNQPGEYDSYTQRLTLQYKRLDALKVHYRLPDLPGMITENVFTDADTLSVKKPLDAMRIFYTTDNTLPTNSSTELKGALVISKSQTIKLAAFTPNGLRGDIYTLNYKKEKYAEAVTASATKPGLVCSYYKAFFKSSQLITGKPDSTFTSNSITVPESVKAPSFGLQYRGYIDIPADGIYSFYLTCDDGGILKIAGGETVNNDGLHSAIEKNGQVALRKGLQPFALDFIEGGGGFTLKLKYSINGSAPQEIPSSWFKN
ncbi:family 20 glycosylhydrolase [Mucilaginibacter gotjawali]|uniref:beta-N-acetylhexosaminidase n=2 Tax=Mucilaginibacter gotjawali TaxID=1550579 RepID=A0A120MZC1_9SPHI|nr:family 20 glycosylhydrolase [Mucilaginibacter gotjawali]MBB3058539.1 hexosaminidase [Mucilaginibacter gotjawali]BAU55763.1 Beta-hexosaminidase [Mucilaginibacter gotjawali]